MVRHILIAAWRNMMANRLISVIAILGLAVGIAVTLLMGLVVRNQMTFENFIPGHDRTYRMFYRTQTGLACRNGTGSAWSIAFECLVPDANLPALRQRLPAIENIARLQVAGPVRFQRDNVTAWESFFWVSPDFFTVMPLPVLHGSLQGALSKPDTMVLTGAMARKYFGRDDVVGQTLTVAGYPLTVRAVLRDMPQNTTSLDRGFFVSMLGAPPAPAVREARDAQTARSGLPQLLALSNVFLRLKPGATLSEAQMTEAYWSLPRMSRVTLAQLKANDPRFNRDTTLLRLDRVNLWEPLNPGIHLRLAVTAAAGALVLLIAAINFVNLMAAAAARREKEVGLRKTCGGGRAALMLQFLGEAVLVVIVAAAIGIAVAEWLLPWINAFLRTGAYLNWSDSVLLAALPGGVALLALAIGAWPAFILSGLRPVRVLRGSRFTSAVRGALATLQFAVLIALVIAASVFWQQRDFAAGEALRVNGDRMLLVRIGAVAGSRRPVSNLTRTKACPSAFVDQVRRLPGVRGAVCSSGAILTGGALDWLRKTGGRDQMDILTADPHIFALYGVKPVVGQLPPPASAENAGQADGAVINMAALRKLGFASPQAAVGNSWVAGARAAPDFQNMFNKDFGRAAIIMAVVPDFSFAPVTQPVAPTLYAPWDTFDKGWDNAGMGVIHIKLDGQGIPETLAAIDRAWTQSGIDAPMDGFFLDDYMQQLYQDMTRDAQFFAGCTALAIVLACLGLFGVAVSTAERRTKEIGVRKAMGARDREIVILLLWHFAQPVLWANVVAWPVAWWLMRRWLSGFAYHIDLHWWVFAGASLGALGVALATVAGQAWLTARQKPVLALRYE